MKVMFVCRGTEYIGVESLSACLKAAGHQVDLVFDPGFDDIFYFRFPALRRLNRWSRLVRQVSVFKPDILAISSVSNTYPYIRQLVKQIKQVWDCYTVIGGVHASAVPNFVLEDPLFDAVCIGEGEEALVELANCLAAGADPSCIRNLCVRTSDGIICNLVRPLRQNLDSLPFLDKQLFFRAGAFVEALNIVTGRGCPYRCNFCVNDFWKKVYVQDGPYCRRFSPKRMVSEIEYFMRVFGIRKVIFQDDIFTYDKAWLSEFSWLYRRSIGLPFQCNVHSHFITPEIAGLLQEAGCCSVCIGIQSADDRKRSELLSRSETAEEIVRAVNLFKKYGIRVGAEYIFGLPGETRDDIEKIVSFNHALMPDETATFMLYPFLGTRMLEQCLADGLLPGEDYCRVKRGEGSYHYLSMIDLPDKIFSYTAQVLLPMLTRIPVGLAMFFLDCLANERLLWLVRILQLASLPSTNLIQFRERTRSYLRILWRKK